MVCLQVLKGRQKSYPPTKQEGLSAPWCEVGLGVAKTRCDLFADELQRAHDLFIAEETAAIEFRQDPVEAELAGQILEAHRHRCWGSDNHFIAQRVFIADGLQRLAALDAMLAHARTCRRALQLQSKRPVELHDRWLGVGSRRRFGLRNIDRDSQIYF